MELKEAIYTRRSIRKFKADKIEKEKIDAIVEAGIMAPSATNLQPWYFVVISDEKAMEELRIIAKGGSEAFREILKERFPTHPEVVESTTQFIGSLGGCPLAILAFVKEPTVGLDDSPVVQSIAAAIQNMILTAHSMGIGSCWMTSLCGGQAADLIRERFAPDHGPLAAIVTFGIPDQESKCPKRKDGRVEFI